MSIYGNIGEVDISQEVGGGQSLIPDNTVVHAIVDSAEFYHNVDWAPDGEVRVNLRVLKPEGFRDFKVRHRLKVMDSDNAKKISALTVLKAYDIIKNGKPSLTSFDEVGSLANARVDATVKIWQSDDKMKSGNYVASIRAPESTSVGQSTANTSFNPDDIQF